VRSLRSTHLRPRADDARESDLFDYILEFSRRDRAGKRHWVADSRRDCDEEDPHGDRYLVSNLQVALWRSKAFRGDIGDDSRVRVFWSRVVEREREREVRVGVRRQVDIENRPATNDSIVDRVKNLRIYMHEFDADVIWVKDSEDHQVRISATSVGRSKVHTL